MTFASPRDFMEQVRDDLDSVIRSQDDLRCGLDLVDIRQFSRDLSLGGDAFLDRVYTSSERTYCAGRHERLAVRFAAKEAFSKALGTGMRGISWREIEIRSASSGKPTIHLTGQAAEEAGRQGLVAWDLSLTHAADSAVAIVVARISNPPLHKSE